MVIGKVVNLVFTMRGTQRATFYLLHGGQGSDGRRKPRRGAQSAVLARTQACGVEWPT